MTHTRTRKRAGHAYAQAGHAYAQAGAHGKCETRTRKQARRKRMCNRDGKRVGASESKGCCAGDG